MREKRKGGEREREREREKATPLTVNQRWKRNKRYMVE
jgi:hypothetical protein